MSAGDLGPLSERELEVLKLVATGATNQEIARALVISPNTVKVHLRNIFEKLGVQSRTEATMAAVQQGLVTVAGAVMAPAVGEVVPLGEVAPVGALPILVATPRRPIARWQRAYLAIAALVVVLVSLLPGWWRERVQAARVTPISDLGQPAAAAPPCTPVQRWTSRDALPDGRSRLALAADASRLYAIGGETASGISDEVWIYDPSSNAWSAGTRKPTAVANAAAAVLGGRIYVPGGSTASGGVTNVLEVYDPAAAAWEARAPLPFSLAAYGLAVWDGRLYLFGGWDGKGYRAETHIYDPHTETWSPGTPMPDRRAFLAASTLEGAIYVVGGYDGERELETVLVYTPAAEGTPADPWHAGPALAQARGGLAAAVVGTRLYVVGGGWNGTLAFNEQYDSATQAWSRIGTPIPGQWRNLGLVAQGQRLYAVGGWSGSYLPVTEEYQALLRQLLPLQTK